jgi:hypothetical protein
MTISGEVRPLRECFAYMDLMDQIVGHRQSPALGFNTCNDSFPRLSRDQLLVVQSIQNSKPEVAFSLVAFVTIISANIPQSYELHCQAMAFASFGAHRPELVVRFYSKPP